MARLYNSLEFFNVVLPPGEQRQSSDFIGRDIITNNSFVVTRLIFDTTCSVSPEVRLNVDDRVTIFQVALAPASYKTL